jgi:hypothetical protein
MGVRGRAIGSFALATVASFALARSAAASVTVVSDAVWSAEVQGLQCSGVSDGEACPVVSQQMVSGTAPGTFDRSLEVTVGSARLNVTSEISPTVLAFSANGTAHAASPGQTAVLNTDLAGAEFEVSEATQATFVASMTVAGGDSTSQVTVFLDSSNGSVFSFSTASSNGVPIDQTFTLQPGITYLYEVLAEASPGQIDPGPDPNAAVTLSLSSTLAIGVPVPPPVAAPALGPRAMALLAAALGVCGWLAARKQSHRLAS